MSVKELEVLYSPKGMITEEFADIAAGIRMNQPVELLLADMGRRSGIQDIDQFAQGFCSCKKKRRGTDRYYQSDSWYYPG